MIRAKGKRAKALLNSGTSSRFWTVFDERLLTCHDSERTPAEKLEILYLPSEELRKRRARCWNRFKAVEEAFGGLQRSVGAESPLWCFGAFKWL